MRRGRRSAVGGRLVLWIALTISPAVLGAQVQDSVNVFREGLYADSVSHISPGGAFWRSFLIPGWGQAATGRYVTGAAFATWEGVCILMTFKAQGEAEHIRAVGADHITTKKKEVQDWTILWIFNHFFAGAEAFVSAHLVDFPEDLHIRAVPRGLMISVPLP